MSDHGKPDLRKAVADWHRRTHRLADLPAPAAENACSPETVAARRQFVDDLAAAVGRLMDRVEPDKLEACISFVSDVSVDLLGVAVAQGHEFFCPACFTGNLQRLTSLFHASLSATLDRQEAGEERLDA